MTQDQYLGLLSVIHQHEGLEYASWVAVIVTGLAAVITAGAAIYAFIFAKAQIEAARDQLTASHAGTKATFCRPRSPLGRN